MKTPITLFAVIATAFAGMAADLTKPTAATKPAAPALVHPRQPDGATAANTVVAYEPVWAIGTGLTPTAADVAEVHAFLRQRLVSRFGADGAQMRLLYGGSVKPSNVRELMGVANVNGALVGGASLKADDFLGILAAFTPH